MKELVPMDDYGIFADTKDTVWANSLIVAQTFGKRHDAVLRDIRNLDCSEKFNLHNFEEITYKDDRGRKQPAVAMTRDGFTFLVMGYRGKKAAAFKEAYIERFNQMESFIKTLVSARDEFPMLTQNIKLLHDHPKAYHFKNECDMLNQVALGMTAKQFRAINGWEKPGLYPGNPGRGAWNFPLYDVHPAEGGDEVHAPGTLPAVSAVQDPGKCGSVVLRVPSEEGPEERIGRM